MSKVSFEHWQKAKEVFEGALTRPDAERAAYLDRACSGNPALRQEVDSLLQSYQEAGSFLEIPAVASVAESLVGEQKTLEIGQRVKHYEIVSLIGEGGMGEVYLAKDTILGRQVAIKLLPEYVRNDPERLRRFKQEARTASTLSHPNVCVIHEIGETDDGRPFIAMEYIEGVTLRQRMNERSMKLGDAFDIAIQIADALTAAHEAGIVHRDVKPENIMIRRDGYVKVLDFGLAKLTERPQTGTQKTLSTLLIHSSPGTVMGTVGYMSPEQARGVSVDVRTDIWSLGVVLYEMVSRHPPFAGPTPTDVVVAIVDKEPPTILHHIGEAPAELERIVRKALRKNPEERYQIVKEMAIDLRSLRKELEKDSQLDRSIAPALAGGARSDECPGASTGKKRIINTDQLDASRMTTFGSAFARSGSWPTRLGLLALVALLMVGGSLAIYQLVKRGEAVPPAPAHFQRINVTKLTTNGNALFASISPDGKYVAYIKGEGGKESLWLRQVGSAGNLTIVPPKEGHYYGLAFSPDGDFIYYAYGFSGDNKAPDIYKVPTLGMGASAVKVNPEEGPTALSHDGKRIAFLRHSRANESDYLIVAKADGSDEQIMSTRKWPNRFAYDWSTTPAWTDKDENIDVAMANSDANGFYISIYELHLADHQERTIALSPQRFEQPNQVSLLSDASGVLLSGRGQGASFEQIWYLGRDGSARTLTNDLSDYRAVMLTADSKSFVTTQTQTLCNIWVAPKGETTRATQVTSGLGRYFDLAWARDGKIVYASDASGRADIYEVAPNGSDVRQLTSGMKRNYAPSVSPDNRFIAFHSNRSGIFQIWRMDRDGSNPVQLTTGNSESNWPQFSADGKSVIYQHFESGELASLWRVPIEGGPPTKVVDGFAVKPAVSPDGKWLGFWYNDGHSNTPWRLALLSLEGGKQIRIFEVSPTVQIQWDTHLRWSADSRSLTYIDHRAGIDNLWAQPIEGGQAKQLTGFTDSSIFSFDWSHDGNLVTSRGLLTKDVVLITDAGNE